MSEAAKRLSEPPSIITRHSAPNIYDQAPVGTQCRVIHSDGSTTLYLQRSSDEEKPRWELIGSPHD